MPRVDIPLLMSMKREGTRITMLTAYDHPTARILDEAGVDTLLVGDSAANVVLGHASTLPITMDEMIVFTSAVSRAAKRAMVIGDMPFMSFHLSIADTIGNAGRFVKEGGATAVKIEGPLLDKVRAVVDAGIPVVGHLGLTPQSASKLGGYRVQGLTAASARRILDDARGLEDAGAFMLVVECVPDRLGALLSRTLSIPVIGIGAGPCDGQVLVLHDAIGIQAGFSPKFVKRFASIGDDIARAARAYIDEVRSGAFPGPEHVFAMPDAEWENLGQ